MKTSKFFKTQFIKIVAATESGQKVGDIYREYGIIEQTFYNLRKKYSGVKPKQLNRLKELESELAQFKRLYADMAL